MAGEQSIGKIKLQILKNIESEEDSSTRYFVPTLRLWTIYTQSRNRKCDPNKAYKIHQDSLALLLQEGYIENASQKQLSDSDVKLTPQGRECLHKSKITINLSSIATNLWVVGIGTAVCAGLILYYIFGLGRQPDKLSNYAIDKVQLETSSSLSKPFEISIGINYLAIKDAIGEALLKNVASNNSYTEYIYLYKDRILQIVVDNNNTVQAFSITSDKTEINLKTYNYDVTLGVTKLIDAKDGLTKCYGFIGANGPSYYFEEHYFGRPGKYLYYYIGATRPLARLLDIRPENTTNDTARSRYKPLQEYDCQDIRDKDRDAFIIRTMMYSSLPLQDIPFLPGPNTEQLNLVE